MLGPTPPLYSSHAAACQSSIVVATSFFHVVAALLTDASVWRCVAAEQRLVSHCNLLIVVACTYPPLSLSFFLSLSLSFSNLLSLNVCLSLPQSLWLGTRPLSSSNSSSGSSNSGKRDSDYGNSGGRSIYAH